MWALPACKANIKKIRIDYRGKGDKFWHSITVTTITERQLTISHLEAGNKFEVRVVIVDINGTEYFPNKQTGVTGFGKVSLINSFVFIDCLTNHSDSKLTCKLKSI